MRLHRAFGSAGTRITLYDVMDYVTAGYPPKFIRGLFDLTEEQINAALAYIEANRSEVEAEYQQVLKEAEELRQYYEEQNRKIEGPELARQSFILTPSDRKKYLPKEIKFFEELMIQEPLRLYRWGE